MKKIKRLLAVAMVLSLLVTVLVSSPIAAYSSYSDTVSITSGTNWYPEWVLYPDVITGQGNWIPENGPVLQVTNASVKVHAFDVEHLSGQNDQVRLNGVYLGDNEGSSDIWSWTQFDLTADQINTVFGSATYPFLLTVTITVDAGGPPNWATKVDQVDIVIDYEVGPEIDIKPLSDPNSINMKHINKDKGGVIPVAILGSADFDATTVDWTTVVFEGASPTHDLSDGVVLAEHQYDANLDSYIDFVFHFRLNETNLSCGDTNGTMTFNDGIWNHTASDAVKLRQCP